MKKLLLIGLGLLSTSVSAQKLDQMSFTDTDGKTHDIYNDYLNEGVAVMFDFWFPTCGWCQTFSSGVESAYLDYGPHGSNKMEILGIESTSATGASVSNYVSQFGVTNPIVDENGPNTASIFGVGSYPTFVIVCPDGSYSNLGGYGSTANSIIQPIKDAIDACPAAVPTPGMSVDKSIISPGQSITVSDESFTPKGNIASWSWEFPNGTPSSYDGQNPPAITYTQEGRHDITLTISVDGKDYAKTFEGIVLVSGISLPNGYCSAAHELASKNEYITKMEVTGETMSIDNSSEWGEFSEYLDQIVDMKQGESYDFTASVNLGWSSGSQVGIWVDWNRDGDFEDNNEETFKELLSNDPNGPHTYTGTIDVPADAAPGHTRIRTRLFYIDGNNFDGPFSPCGDQKPGEVEDYVVQVIDKNVGQADINKPALKFFPNPANNTLYLEGAGLEGQQLLITDLSGRQIVKVITGGQVSIDDLRSGSYFIQIAGQTRTSLMVKM